MGVFIASISHVEHSDYEIRIDFDIIILRMPKSAQNTGNKKGQTIFVRNISGNNKVRKIILKK